MNCNTKEYVCSNRFVILRSYDSDGNLVNEKRLLRATVVVKDDAASQTVTLRGLNENFRPDSFTMSVGAAFDICESLPEADPISYTSCSGEVEAPQEYANLLACIAACLDSCLCSESPVEDLVAGFIFSC